MNTKSISVKWNRIFSKRLIFTLAAIPIGAIAGFLCCASIDLLTTFLDTIPKIQDFHPFAGFDLWTIDAAFSMPVGGVLLPLTYLLFFRGVTLIQALRIVGWLTLSTVVAGILGLTLLHSIVLSPVVGFIIGVIYTLRKLPVDEKPTVAKTVAGSLIILIVGVITIPLYWVAGIFWSTHEIRGVEKKMKSPYVYESVATNLALYCQSISALGLTNYIGSAQMPQPIPKLDGFETAKFDSDSAIVIFGGGFYHYGYGLELDQNLSNAGTNYWNLYYQNDNPSHVLLIRIALAKSAQMPRTLFVSNTLAEYSRRIAGNPTELEYHKSLIRFLLDYDPPGVRQACLDAIQDMPDSWWPRLTLALWDSGRGKFPEASKTFAGFAAEKPSYSHYIYLAWFYQKMNHPNEAAAVIEKAIQFPIVDLEDDDSNSECRGYTVGVSAYKNAEYNTVIKLCDALLPVRINGDYAKAALTSLRHSAQVALNGQPEDFEPDSHILLFDPYEDMYVDKLLGR